MKVLGTMEALLEMKVLATFFSECSVGDCAKELEVKALRRGCKLLDSLDISNGVVEGNLRCQLCFIDRLVMKFVCQVFCNVLLQF